MTIKLDKRGHIVKAEGEQGINVALAQSIAARAVLANPPAALTDNSGGVAGSITSVSADLVNVAASGSSLASAATAASALGTVKDAIAELVAKAKAFADLLGVDYSEDFVTGTNDGTIAAITVATTGAATGAQATETNASVLALNANMIGVAVLTNKVARAVGAAEIAFTAPMEYFSDIENVTVAVGTAASPGVTKVALDAKLAAFAVNVATVAAKLNALRTVSGVPKVLIV